MIYYCQKCLFIFMRTGTVENCPDCGSQNIRTANEDEKAEYERNRAQNESNIEFVIKAKGS